VSGYTSGGDPESQRRIDKFPFASDANATDVGDITADKRQVTGQSSTVSGYVSAGVKAPTNEFYNVIEKFSFSSDGNGSDVGDLTVARSRPTSQSSTVSGYTSGGVIWPSPYYNIIEKFPFASDGNATDVGDLTVGTGTAAGAQY
jgi:hypothetical protein